MQARNRRARQPELTTLIASRRDVRRGGWARFEFARATPNVPGTIVCIDNLVGGAETWSCAGTKLNIGLTVDGTRTAGGDIVIQVRAARVSERLFAMVPLVLERIRVGAR